MKEIKMLLEPEEPGGGTRNTWCSEFSVCRSVFWGRLGAPWLSLSVPSSGEIWGGPAPSGSGEGGRGGRNRVGCLQVRTPASSQPGGSWKHWGFCWVKDINPWQPEWGRQPLLRKEGVRLGIWKWCLLQLLCEDCSFLTLRTAREVAQWMWHYPGTWLMVWFEFWLYSS